MAFQYFKNVFYYSFQNFSYKFIFNEFFMKLNKFYIKYLTINNFYN